MREQVQGVLKLTDEQLPSFLEFFGYWLGNGSVEYVHSKRGAGYKAVSCSVVKQEEVSFIKQRVHQLGLTPSEFIMDEESLIRHSNQPNKIITHLHIIAPRWLDLFDREFGQQKRTVPRRRSVSASLSTASTVLSDSLAEEVGEVGSSSDVEAEEELMNDETVGLKEWDTPVDPDHSIQSAKR